MKLNEPTDDELRAIFRDTRRIAVVGASNKPHRPSFDVMGFLLRHGFAVVPVNPLLAGRTIHGQVVVGSLAEAGPLDFVDIFRSSDKVAPVVDEAIGLGARTIWMQLGVFDSAAAARARGAGLLVVMDRCPKIEIMHLGLG